MYAMFLRGGVWAGARVQQGMRQCTKAVILMSF